MCGIVGVISKSPVNQLIYDALLLLQHRGQDAAGIVTMQGTQCFMHKARGMVRDVFRTRNMRALPGVVGLGQVRYPTAGNSYSEEEAQPFYVNAPFGIVLVHNGNLTNAQVLRGELEQIDRRHINTDSDTEVLINVLAHELQRAVGGEPLTPDSDLRCGVGGASPHQGLVCGDCADRRPWPAGLPRSVRHPAAVFRRDDHRRRRRGDGGQRIGRARRHRPSDDSAMSRRARRSSSISKARFTAASAPSNPSLHPCMFEFVYLARPDSVMDGISVYQARLNMGADAGAAADLDDQAEGYRCRDPDPRIEPAVGDAAGAEDRQAVPRRLREEPLCRPHLHHAGAEHAQEIGAPETQCDRQRVQGSQRAAGRRFDRPRHDQQGDRADGARGRCAQGLPGFGGAAGALSERLRHRHADRRRTGRPRAQHRGDPPVHRRRCADLPGYRCDEEGGRRDESGGRRLRGIVLRRLLRHRRCQRQRPRP